MVQQRRRVRTLDAIRAVAALAVAAFHYGFFPFGYLGVELFFLLSGFVLSLPSQYRSARDFFFARAIRLYPTYWACLLLTFLATSFRGQSVSVVDLFANLTMVTPIFGRRYVDGVYWSLFEELVFYVFVGVAGAYLPRRSPLPLALFLAALSMFYGIVVASGIALPVKATMVVKYFPFFSGGIAAAVLFRHFALKESLSGFAMATAACLAVAVPLQSHFYNYSAHLSPALQGYEKSAICLVCLVFYGAVALAYKERTGDWHDRSGVVNVAMGLLAKFGAITYPFYLLHDQFGKAVWSATAQIPGGAIAPRLVLVTAVSLVVHKVVEVGLSSRLRAWVSRCSAT